MDNNSNILYDLGIIGVLGRIILFNLIVLQLGGWWYFRFVVEGIKFQRD